MAAGAPERTPARPKLPVVVRNPTQDDIPAIQRLTVEVYPTSAPWSEKQLRSHERVFPQGQFVAVTPEDGRIVGYAASLIVQWDEYSMNDSWRDFTDVGMFTNHDPDNGRTLYAAEVMVAPTCQGRGVGSALYAVRRDLCRQLGLRRIRAGARLRGYHAHAHRLQPEEYALAVSRGEIWDATVSFQMKQGFRIIGVARGYLRHDPESHGHAAVIEWVNPDLLASVDQTGRDRRFDPPEDG